MSKHGIRVISTTLANMVTELLLLSSGFKRGEDLGIEV